MIHNISIATYDDLIKFGDDVNIYPVYLSRAIIIWGNRLNWLEKPIVSDHIFCQFLLSRFGNSLMATECMWVFFLRRTMYQSEDSKNPLIVDK